MKPFVKIEDGILDNPKIMRLILEAGYAGLGLYVAGITYCARNRTDGEIPRLAVAQRLYNPPADLVEALVRCGLWIEEGDAYKVHDFLDVQTPRERIERHASKDADRKRVDRFVEKAEKVASSPEVTIDEIRAMVVKNANSAYIDGDVDASVRRYCILYTEMLPKALAKFAGVKGLGTGDALRNLVVHHAASMYLGRDLEKAEFTRLNALRAKYGFVVIEQLSTAASKANGDALSYLDTLCKKAAQ